MGFFSSKTLTVQVDIELYLVPSNHQTLIWFIDHFKEITEAWTLFFFPEIGQHSPALMVFFRVIDWYIILWLWEPRFSDSQLLYHCEAERREREGNKERWEVLSMCWVLSRRKKSLFLPLLTLCTKSIWKITYIQHLFEQTINWFTFINIMASYWHFAVWIYDS